MKSFVLKTSFFALPFILLYGLVANFSPRTQSPDLLRVGHIIDIFPGYQKTINRESIDKQYFQEYSTKGKNNSFEILTIGDSFCEQGVNGFKNFIAKKHSLLHIDRFLSQNQIQTLIGLSNGNFFEKIKIKYVILEIVERQMLQNCKNLNFNKKLSVSELESIKEHLFKFRKSQEKSIIYPNSLLKFPYNSLLFYYSNTITFNKIVKRYFTTDTLFSIPRKEVLFFSDELEVLKENNILENAVYINQNLNKLDSILKTRNIKLIVLPAPDKYDLYFDYFIDNDKMIEPLFFKNFNALNKNYEYINSKQLLKAAIVKEKDIYFYNDSHWSISASKIVTNEIEKILKKP